MEPGLKQRLTGAAVLVILGVIFIPMLLNTSPDEKQGISGTNIPPQPADMPAPPTEDFSSRIVPLEQSTEQVTATETAATPATTTPGTEAPEPAPEVEAPPPPSASVATAKEPPQPAVESVDHANGVGVTAWVVQLGSFSSEENAEALNQKLRKAGFKAFVEPLKQNIGTVYRVRIGPELKRSDADAINDRLKKNMPLDSKDSRVVHYP